MLFAIPWSFAAVTEGDSREKFDRFFRDLVTDKNEDFPMPASITKLEGMFPDVGMVQDFCFEVRLCLLVVNLARTFITGLTSTLVCIHSLQND